MGFLPVLSATGTLRWPHRQAALEAWDQSLGRGVVIATAERPLQPLEHLEIVVEGDGFDDAITLRSEVVRIEPERVMLRLLDGPVPVPVSLTRVSNPFAAVSVASASAENPFASSASTGAFRVGADEDDDVMPAPGFGPTPAARAAEEKRLAEEQRVAEEQRAAEERRVAEEQRVAEERRLAEEQRVAEALRLAEEQRVAEEQRAADAKAAEDKRIAEERRVADEAKAAEDKRIAEERRIADEVRAAEDARIADERRVADEARASEATRVTDERRVADEARADDAGPVATDGAAALTQAEAKAKAAAEAAQAAAAAAAAAAEAEAALARAAEAKALAEAAGAAAATTALPTTTNVTPPDAGGTLAALAKMQAPPPKATLPPFFSGETLRFAGLDDLRAARADMISVGALLAVCDSALPVGTVMVRLAAGATEGRIKVGITVSQAQPGTVVVQAISASDWRPVLDELDPPTMAAHSVGVGVGSSSAVAKPASVTLQFPKQGTIRNPLTARGILAMPLHRPVSEADLQNPSLPLLLRWLRTTKGIMRLDLTASGQPVHTLIIVDGREVRSPVSLATLGKAMAHNAFTYELTDLARAPNLSHTGRTLHLIVEVVRGLLAAVDVDEIESAFPHSKETRLVRAVGSVSDALGFQGALSRIVKSYLQGDSTVADVTRSAAGARAAWDVLVTLELFAGLTFAAGESRRLPRAATPGPMRGVAAETRPAMLDKDHFSALGLHWSCSPSDVAEAYGKAKREYGVGGFKRPKDETLAAECMKRIEEANNVLSNGEARRQYRRETFNMIWPHQAQLLVQQAKLAMYRKDIAEARNLLAAAQDMSPSGEAQHLLDALTKS